METKTIVVSVIASVLVVLGVVAFTPAKVINQESQLGAVASPDIMSPYFSFGGVRQWAAHTDTLNTASTTICAMQSPAATSTLRLGSVRLTTGSTTAVVLEMAKSATYAASTTRISYGAVAAGDGITLNSFVASTTSTGASGYAYTANERDIVFAPNTYLTVKYGGSLCGNGGTTCNTFVGNCSAVWQEN